MDLSLKEYAVYATIALYANEKGISSISRDSLLNLNGIKNAHTPVRIGSSMTINNIISGMILPPPYINVLAISVSIVQIFVGNIPHTSASAARMIIGIIIHFIPGCFSRFSEFS